MTDEIEKAVAKERAVHVKARSSLAEINSYIERDRGDWKTALMALEDDLGRLSDARAAVERLESSACDRRDWCVAQKGHQEPCKSVLFTSRGEPK